MADTSQDVRERQEAEMKALKDSPTGEELKQEDDPERAAEIRRVNPEGFNPVLDPQYQDPVRLPQDVREVHEQLAEDFDQQWGTDTEKDRQRQQSGREISGAETTAGAAHMEGQAKSGSRKSGR